MSRKNCLVWTLALVGLSGCFGTPDRPHPSPYQGAYSGIGSASQTPNSMDFSFTDGTVTGKISKNGGFTLIITHAIMIAGETHVRTETFKGKISRKGNTSDTSLQITDDAGSSSNLTVPDSMAIIDGSKLSFNFGVSLETSLLVYNIDLHQTP